jgi:hypothetical protein
MEHISVSLKQASEKTLETDATWTIQLRYKIVNEWKAIGVHFQKNCVSVDEAGFHSQIIRGRAWSKVEDAASVKVHTNKDMIVSIVVCISSFSTNNFSKFQPL